jgi:hypothetical protein
MSDMSPHVRQQQEPRLAFKRLALEIDKIDHHILGDFDQQGPAAGSSDGAGHQGQG